MPLDFMIAPILTSLFVICAPFLALILFGLIGRQREATHFRDIARRTKKSLVVLLTDTQPREIDRSKRPQLVTGEVVIAGDYLKRFFAAWRILVGGEVRSYTSMMQRAKAEAILRMLESAESAGYNAVANVRVETSDILKSPTKQGVAAEVLVAGTAYRLAGGR